MYTGSWNLFFKETKYCRRGWKVSFVFVQHCSTEEQLCYGLICVSPPLASRLNVSLLIFVRNVARNLKESVTIILLPRSTLF